MIATAAAAEFPLKVEHPGVRRSAVLQQRGGDMSPPSANRTARNGHMPSADVWDYAGEKRAALEAWEAHLAAVLAGGSVVPMPTARGAA
jgi:hypothetical protein